MNRHPSTETIGNEEEFESLLLAVDSQLAQEQVPIVSRPAQALRRLSQKLRVELPTHPPRRVPQAGHFDPLELSIRLYGWFEARYGNRLERPLAIGHAAVFLRGALYRMHIPRPSPGQAAISRTSETYGPPSADEAPDYNLSDLVEGMTPDLLRALSGDEVLRIAVTLDYGMRAFSALRVLKDVPLLNEAAGDLEAAAHHLTEHHPQLGLSRWASAQAAEKAAKAFVKEHHTNAKLGHDLSEIYREAESWGMDKPPQNLIDALQCSPGVRYNEPPTTLEEAVMAHFASLQLVGVAAREVAESLWRTLPELPEFMVEGEVGTKKGRMSLHEFAQEAERQHALASSGGKKGK